MPPKLANNLARVCAYSATAPEWVEFVQLVKPVAALAARRVCAIWQETSNTAVSEIVQEVFLKLCEDDRRILREFEDRGTDSFQRLVRIITASVATDYFRRIRAEKRGGFQGTLPLDTWGRGAEASDLKATLAVEQPALLAQLDGLLRLHPETISLRDRNLFWLYYRQGLTSDAIARIPAIGLTAKGVQSALLRIVRQLRETVENGKPAPVTTMARLTETAKRKGFSPAVAMNTVKGQ